MRPPPEKTRTAATPSSQLPSRPSSAAGPAAASHLELSGIGNAGPSGSGSDATRAYGNNGDYHSPSAVYGGRNFQRNGPRMGGGRHATGVLPAIVTSDAPMRSSSVPLPDNGPMGMGMGMSLSPTTPRQSRFYDTNDVDSSGSSLRPRTAGPGSGSVGGITNLRGSVPASPTEMKSRGLSVGQEKSRERRQSGNSARSAGSSRPRESPSDYTFGEELGRGSYSTVVHAVRALPSGQSPTSPRPPRQYAIKIINQAHLVQEKKTKYAMIERDALVRLNAPLSGIASPSNTGATREHRRGLSGSSNGGAPRKNHSSASLNQSGTSHSQSHSRRDSTIDRLSINTSVSDGASSTGTAFGSSAPLSPTLVGSMAGRRPSRSADPPEMVPERSEDGHSEVLEKSRPPSPVREDSREHVFDAAITPPKGRAGAGHDYTYGPPETPVYSAGQVNGGARTAPSTPNMSDTAHFQVERRIQTGNAAEKREARRSNEDRESAPRSRRASKAPSDRSSRSVGAKSHPGIIRLFSTFNDATSLYFVLDLAANGELLGCLRKYGSLDTESARYYAAQLLDTVDFMHERGVVHRDLKPENILLDDDMRIKVTDFGSAKLLDADPGPEEGKKRSFVGSADFVSPEVLRNEPANAASDVWAFGCIVFQLFVGKPPFRGATDYLTFQKILKREMEYPDGFPDEARDLIETILDLDGNSRPTASDLKAHPFFASIDWSTIWTIPAPPMSTGLTKPVITLANIDPQSDMWAVFDDDVSDGGFGDDADLENAGMPHDPSTSAPHADSKVQSQGHQRVMSTEDPHRWSPQYDHVAAAQAVRTVDLADTPSSPIPAHAAHLGGEGEGDELDPPRPGWMDSVRKKRGFSRGSARTSSSSSANRTALTGLLESMGIHSMGQPGSGRTSRNSMKSEDARPVMGQNVQSPAGKGRRKGSRSGSTSISGPSAGSQGQMQAHAAGGAEGWFRLKLPQLQGVDVEDGQWSSLLLPNERVLFTSAVTIRTSALPSFLTPNATKRRQLVLTDFPRLFAVKDETPGSSVGSSTGNGPSTETEGIRPSSLVVKNECILVPRPSAASVLSTNSSAGAGAPIDLGASTTGAAGHVGAAGAGGANRLVDVQEKGPKGFLVNTSVQAVTYYAETAELRNEWIRVIRQSAE